MEQCRGVLDHLAFIAIDRRYRISRISTFRSISDQARSQVRTGRPVIRPTARQARSAREEPSALVVGKSLAASRAQVSSNGCRKRVAWRDGWDQSRCSAASTEPRVRATRASTSAQLTVLTQQPATRCSATISPPGSPRIKARSAEASSTELGPRLTSPLLPLPAAPPSFALRSTPPTRTCPDRGPQTCPATLGPACAIRIA